MAVYIIDYDLRAPGRNYDSLIEAIKTYPWAKIMKSTWAIETTKTATQVRDHLKGHIDSNDKLFVVKAGNEAAWFNLDDDVAAWIKARIK